MFELMILFVRKVSEIIAAWHLCCTIIAQDVCLCIINHTPMFAVVLYDEQAAVWNGNF